MRTVVFLVLLAAIALPANAASPKNADDVAMARRINNHLQQSGQLRNYRIGASCRNGSAILEGNVASAEQRDTAIRLAEQISGVSSVDCRLTYPGATDSDAETHDLSTAFAETSSPAEQADAGVMHAYNENQTASNAPAQRGPMLSRTSIPARGMQQRGMQHRPRSNMPRPMMNPAIRQASAESVYQAGGACPPGGYSGGGMGMGMDPSMGGQGMGPQAVQAGFGAHGHGQGPNYENPQMPGYAWPSYASHPNYAAVSYPKQYSPTAWPYIGPFYPYPQVPLAWRKVSLEWDDGWWFLDFSAHNSSH